MKKMLLALGTKVVGKNVMTETNSACAFMAYQPKMPDSARKLTKKRNKRNF